MYAAEEEEYQTISKIGTGFSEEQLVQLSEQLKALVIPAPKPYYRRVLLQLMFCPSSACMRSGLCELLPG